MGWVGVELEYQKERNCKSSKGDDNMMTASEAIEKLRAYHKCQILKVKGIYEDCNENLCDNCDLCYAQGNTGEHIESIEIAIQALEKQIAKKPTYEGDGYWDGQLVYDTWVCPCCGRSYELDYDDYDYCPNCGQNLDWSDLSKFRLE